MTQHVILKNIHENTSWIKEMEKLLMPAMS